MITLDNIEHFLNRWWGEYETKWTSKSYYERSLSYVKKMVLAPTIEMVIKPPIEFDPISGGVWYLRSYPIRFFLYDKETDLIVGRISEIDLDDWQDSLLFKIYTAEDRLERSECPECGFWLLERTNMHGHAFMGCSGFPDCEYSAEIDKVYDDED